MEITSYLLGKKAGGGGSTPVLQDKEIEITQNGETTVRADSGYDGLSSVEVTTNVPQPSGTKSITENGTYDVTNYASANVNVSSQSSITSLSDLRNAMKSQITTYDNYIKNLYIQEGYYTNDPITIYTPYRYAQYFVIHKRSSGKYRCIWSNRPFIKYNSTSVMLYSYNINTVSTGSLSDLTPQVYGYESTTNYFAYYSNEVDTINDVINGMKNNTLTYTQWSQNNSFGAVPDSPYAIPYTNCDIYSETSQLSVSRYLSPNITIVASS